MAELALGRQHAMAESAGMRQFAWLWGGLFLVLFPLLGLLGVFMRMYQAGWLQELVPDPQWFYAAMTLHGLGLVGLIYAASLWRCCGRYRRMCNCRPGGCGYQRA